jgi:pyruvate dehydrogenase E2 component (dihydrolipoamide acetyltransferase)
MASEVLLPKQGNSVESCIIVEWKVEEGASVASGDVLLEVETDKATMEVESTADGVLLKQLVGEGDDVPVLSPVAIVGQKGEKVDLPEKADASGSSDSAGSAKTETEQPVDAATGSASTDADSDSGSPVRPHTGGAKISPRARKLADKLGVDYSGLSGSGPGGRIMAKDVENAPRGGTATGKTAAAPSGAEAAAAGRPAQATESVQIKGVRKLIAERMHASLASTAQLTMDASADARQILSYRKRLKASGEERLQSVSINDLILFAVSRTVASSPELNRTFHNGTVTSYQGVNLGFAVDTPKGLMVPVIPGADTLTLVELSRQAHTLAEKCQAGSISPDNLQGGTFTVTNLGAFGIERFTPVLNPPQVGILGVCAVTQRPAPDGEGTIPMMGLSLTIDHQIVDGAPAARFLKAMTEAVAELDLTLAK